MIRIAAIAMTIIFWGCGSAPKSIQELETWFKDEKNRYTVVRKHKDITISSTYNTSDLMAINELRNIKNPSEKTIDSLVKSYDNASYFVVELGMPTESEIKNDIQTDTKTVTYPEYSKNIDKLSFGMEKNTFLVIGTDTVRPLLYQYERGYELGKREKLVFMFPKITSNKSIELDYIDEIFNSGINKFLFKVDRSDSPKLNKEILL
jgi:hypothetical protein